MNDQELTLKEKLKALRDAYGTQLPTKLAKVEGFWSHLCNKPWDWAVTEDLHRSVHTLAGSAPTFGFNEAGQNARQVELVLKDWVNNQISPSDSERQTLSVLIDTLMNSPTASNEMPKHDTTMPNWVERKPNTHLIYLVDNNHDFATELATQLEHFDYQVKIFNSGATIDSAMEIERPAAIIANVTLPEGDLAGILLIRGVKALYSANLPVIFISKQNDFMSRLHAVRAGGDAYFLKPLDIGPLVDQLDQLTQNHVAEPFRVLVIDDDLSLATHYSLILEQAGMEVAIITDPRSVSAALAEVRPELILMDVYMPICSGLELAKLIRQQDAYLGIPIVFLSSETNLEKQFQAMRMGGDDFLTKPISDKKLIASAMIRADRARALNTLMMQDSLTGLFKHTKIKEQLAMEASRAKRTGAPLSFAMIDIDFFKKINDNYGHLTGDRVIKSLARLLQQRLRQCDSIGRYGGEEFAAVLPDCTLDNAKMVFEEVRESFARLIFLHEGKEFRVTVSIGIADAKYYVKSEDINHAADEALFLAKHEGRNQVVLDQGVSPTSTDSATQA